MRLKELASRLTVCRLSGDGDTEITGIEFDSRRVQPGDLFVCVSGFKQDGHLFAEQAIEAGASALVTERELSINVPQLIVKSSRSAMAVLSAHFYQYPSMKMKVIGVTGTNGKTTTAGLIEQILAFEQHTTGLMGNIHVKIGSVTHENKATNTQEAIYLQQYFKEMADAQTDYCVMEVSSHGLELGRVLGTRFRTAVFTNLTQDHLDFHGTMEAYRNAKGLLFSRMDNGYSSDAARTQFAVLNNDDEASAYFASITPAQVITYSIDADADVRATDIQLSAEGTTFRCETYCGSAVVTTKLVGKFNVYNTLAAIAAILAEGISLGRIAEALKEAMPVEGRMEVVSAGQPFLVLVDYAHTPDGLENALSAIKQFAAGRILCVFGCGGDRDRKKRPIMGEIAARLSDVVIVTSDNPRTEDPQQILDDIVPGLQAAGLESGQYELIVDRKAAIEYAVAAAQPGDVVLIAGKGHETYQDINGVKTDFDDRLTAKEAIRGRYHD